MRVSVGQEIRSVAGFTLIELMIVMALMAIVLAVGVPSMATMVQDSRLSATKRELLGILSLARSEAVTRNQVVTLSHTSATAGDWSRGVRVYTDTETAGNTAYTSANDTLIQDISNIAGDGISIMSDTAGQGFISFKSDGILNESGNQVMLAVCDERGSSHGYAIVIGLSGRSEVTKTATCNP